MNFSREGLADSMNHNLERSSHRPSSFLHHRGFDRLSLESSAVKWSDSRVISTGMRAGSTFRDYEFHRRQKKNVDRFDWISALAGDIDAGFLSLVRVPSPFRRRRRPRTNDSVGGRVRTASKSGARSSVTARGGRLRFQRWLR